MKIKFIALTLLALLPAQSLPGQTIDPSQKPEESRTIAVDGKQVAKGRIDKTMPLRISMDETFDVGEDTGTPVTLSYDVPFKFTGTIEKVVVSLGQTKLSTADHQKVNDLEKRLAAD